MRWRWFLSAGALALVLCSAVVVIVVTSKHHMAERTEELLITTTWNNVTVPEDEHVHIKLTLQEKHLLIDVEAKFYDDPSLPDTIAHPGTNNTLYNYEVAEVFLLGSNEHYLEIELGPRGHYYVLELSGQRNVTRAPIEIENYQVTNDGTGRWSARATISRDDIPSDVSKLNAYAIHGSGEKRVYMALHPAPNDSAEHPKPDFHKLSLFGSTHLFQ